MVRRCTDLFGDDTEPSFLVDQLIRLSQKGIKWLPVPDRDISEGVRV